MTNAQLLALKAHILANTSIIPANLPWSGGFDGVQVKDVPNNSDGNATIAGFYAQLMSPAYWVWKTDLRESDVYDTESDLVTPTNWDWTIYKNQGVSEQNAWAKMFMGGNCNFARLNYRRGADAIFPAAQRNHILAIGRRQASIFEKLFAIAVVGGAPANGNDMVAGNRGQKTNPDVMVIEGAVSPSDINSALNLV